MPMEDFDLLESPMDNQQAPQLDITKYLRGIWKRKWIIIILTALLAVPFYFVAKNQIPMYKCKVTIQSKIYDDQDKNLFDAETQAEIRSQSFTERIAAVLGLAIANSDTLFTSFDQVFTEYHTTTDPVVTRYKIVIDELGSYFLYQKEGDVKTVVDSANVWDAVESLRSVNGISFKLDPNFVFKPAEFHFRVRPFDKGVKFLQYGIEKTWSRSGKFMILELKGEDPAVIPDNLNRVADAYLQEIQKLKSLDTDSYREMLRRRLAAAEKNMKKSEASLRVFYSQYPLSLDNEKKNLMELVNTNEQSLRDLPFQRKQLTSFLMRLDTSANSEYGSQYRKEIVHSLSDFPAMQQETELIIYRQNLYALEKKYSDLSSEYSQDHIDVAETARKIYDIQDKIIEFASSFRNTLAAKESEYRKTRDMLQTKLRSLPQDEYRLMELERNKSIDEDLYKLLFGEMQKLQVSEASQDPGIRILDRAIRPNKPINPSKKTQVMLGGGLGFLLGLLISIIIDILDKSLHTLKDVERHLNLPVLGTIPIVSFKDIPDFRDDQKALQIDKQLVTHDYSPTPIGEAYRALRTQLLFSKETEQIQTLLITSISPEEGKSFTASNLSIILAQQRTNTLLVDADLRRGVQHNTFSVNKDAGLTQYLSNKGTLSDLVQKTHIPNLSVLSCGPFIPNPSELLGSMQMRRFIAEVKRKFDFIIFDAPPLDAATDSVVIGTFVDAVTVVVKAGSTNRKSAKERLEIFNTVPANLIGVVVNGTEEALMKSSYSYYHY
jgi:polysaccharide biosynthesis transport protein